MNTWILGINFIISAVLYGYFIIEEKRTYATFNRLASWLRPYEERLCVIFICTTYFWILSTIIWMIEGLISEF